MEAHRRELTGYCYRMLGSGGEAEDAVQETFLRAWRAREGFEGRGHLRSWLYSIATNVCIDMPQRPQRRARPMDLVSPSRADITTIPDQLPEHAWVQPAPDARVLPAGGDPAELAALRESIRLAFVTALQHLPPRQRAVLILREVLHWQASEVAELLGTTAASVNSALQRARATLDAVAVDDPAGTVDSVLSPEESGRPLDADEEKLVARYAAAFESYDIDSLVSLLREDATFSMPPIPLWLRGPRVGPRLDARQRYRLQGFADRAHSRQRRSRLRPVPHRSRRWLRCLGSAGPRARRGTDRRDPQLPEHGAVRGLRAAVPSRLTD